VIITKTPLRVSFVGGGTDLPEFADVHGGAVVSTSIDKWISVFVARRFEGDVRVSYSQTEIVDSARDLQHSLVREAMVMCGIPRGVDIATLSDVPSKGTGLGSSSVVTVGVLNALYAFQGIYKTPAALAEEASRIEIEVLGKPIGRQDQYAAALGGLNLIEFLPRGGGVVVEPIVTSADTVASLHRSLMMFYTGRQRAADAVLTDQREAVVEGSTTDTLVQMRDLAYEMRDALASGDSAAVGGLLHRNWLLKRGLAQSISDDAIDALYDRARDAGATGGKILGAGGGGFLLVVAPERQQEKVRAALSDLREVPFRFSARGSQIVYVDGNHG
jgi:D-glycero-alpha-D-manno-heptose-7-phosphate kinase